MPPKPNKKEVQNKQKKIVEDKTFGLKNKNKSKKVQQYVKNVESQVKFAGISRKDAIAEEEKKKAREQLKQAKEAEALEQALLFKPVVSQQRVAADADPKTIICEFFKKGSCNRGNKCKFSHDIAKTGASKLDIYSDPRDAERQKEEKEHQELYSDQSKLEALIATKSKGKLPPTDIVCKYFLDAIEKRLYGHFWECPNGADCHYRHALPPGFVLRSKDEKKKQDDDDDGPTLEEQIDEERRALDLTKCTPVTLEGFKKWKEARESKRQAEVEQKRKEAAKKDGKGYSALSGRDLFRYDPSLFQDDADADDEKYEASDDYYQDEEEEKGNQAKVYEQSSSFSSAALSLSSSSLDENLYLDDEALPDDDEEEDDDDEGEEDDDDDEEEEESKQQ